MYYKLEKSQQQLPAKATLRRT